jgi:hypothetical protein
LPLLPSFLPPNQFFTDKLVVLSGDDRLEVPLSAAMPTPSIEFESFSNMGLIVLDQTGEALMLIHPY